MLLGFSLAAGFTLIQYFTVPPLSMTIVLLALLVCIASLIWTIIRFFKGKALVFSILLALAGFTGSYLVTNTLFLNQEEHRSLPEIQTPATDVEHTAVIYLTHGEPPAYSPMPWIETFHELDNDGVSFMPVAVRPMFFNAFRKHYLEAGGSPHNYVHQAMINSLEQMMRMEGDQDTRFYLSFLDSNPRPDEAAIRAMNDGANRLVISYVFLTISSHTKAGKEQVEEIDLPQYGIEICHTEPLWDSELLMQMFVERANRNLGNTPKNKVGILLVGHGQPEDWDKIYASQTEQEIQFREDVVEMLVADGFVRENISLAWMEFKEPGIKETALKMADQGVEKILVYAASISASSLHSEYDIPQAVLDANLPPGIEVIHLGAWNNDPLVIQAIREKLRDCDI
jgi:protoheme ferro-lyase